MWPRLQERLRRLAFPLLQIAALMLIGLVFYLGIHSERSGFVREVIDPGFRKLSDPVLNAFRRKPPPVTLLRLELDSASMDSLRSLGKRALQERRVRRQGNASFSATLRLGDRVIPAVVGLREGASLPGRYPTWPLHVRMLPGDTVMDMQTFDILPIVDEAPLWSIVLHTLLDELGHVSLGAAVVEVELNDGPMGLCILHGRPDATILQRWSRGNGPVLRFDDNLWLNALEAMALRDFPSHTPPQADWLVAPLLLHSADGAELGRRSQQAIRRMDAFRAGEAKAADVFDTDRVARLLALCDLLGTQSAMDWWNLRFLVDSISEVLVPVPMHVTARAPITAIFGVQQANETPGTTPARALVDRLLSDPEINAKYIAYLDTFSTAIWWENMLERTQHRWSADRSVVNAEFPWLDLDLTAVAHDRTVIRQTLHPKEVVLAYIRDAQLAADGIALANVHALPVMVTGVLVSSGDTLRESKPTLLLPRKRDSPLTYTLLPMDVRRAGGAPTQVLVRVVGSTEERSVAIRTWSTFGAN